MVIAEIPEMKTDNKITKANKDSASNLSSPLLNKVDDIELGRNVTFYRPPAAENNGGILGRAKSYFFPPAPSELIEMDNIRESGARMLRDAELMDKQLKLQGQRGEFKFSPMAKCTGMIIGALAAGAAGGYAYRYYTGTQSQAESGTSLAPDERYVAPRADKLLTDANLLAKRPPRHIRHEANRGHTTTPAPQEPTDGVKIVKLFDFSCLNIRNNMTRADIVRTFAEGFKEPFDRLAKESQVIHHMNTKHTGCPPRAAVAELEEYTKPIDFVFTTLTSAVPDMWPVAALQLILGPLLEVIADAMDGKIDPDQHISMAIQLAMMMRQALPTLKPDERAMLYTKPNERNKLKSSIKNRFSIADGKVSVRVGNKIHELKETKVHKLPYIENENGDYFHIKYNQDTEKWEQLDADHFDDTDGLVAQYHNDLAKLAKFGISLKNDAPDCIIEALHHGEDKDLFLMTKSDGTKSKGVFVHDTFVPVDRYKLHGKMVTATKPVDNRRVILEDSVYGWHFERPSTAIDKHLAMIFDSPVAMPGRDFTADRRYSAIDDYGIVHDNLDYFYIKHKDQYYLINTREDGLTYGGAPTSVISRQNGIYFLKSENDALFGNDPVLVGADSSVPWGSTGRETTRIEKFGLDYLARYGRRRTYYASTSRVPLKDGIYEETVVFRNNQQVFYTPVGIFFIQSFSDKNLIIQRDGGGFIEFKLMNNIYLRVRPGKIKEEFKFDYKFQRGCGRVKRAPVPGCSSLPVMIENDFEQALSSFIDNGKTSDASVLDKQLTEDKWQPGGVIYEHINKVTNKHKQYFLHKGHFFEAVPTPAYDETNHVGREIWKIYGKGNFLTKKEYIDAIVIDKKLDKILIKPESVYLAEQINVTGAEAKEYIKSRKYRFVGGVRDVDDAINTVAASGKFYVGEPPEVFQPDFAASVIESRIKGMFPERITNSKEFRIKTFGLNDNPQHLTPYQQAALRFVKEKVDVIKQFIFRTVRIAMKYHTEDFDHAACRDYLNALFNEPGDKHLDDVERYLRTMIKRMGAHLTYDNVKIVTAVPTGEAIAQPDIISSEGFVLTDEERSSGEVAFMTTDKKGIMYINLDKAYVKPGLDHAPGADLISVIIHELSHYGGMTIDSAYAPREKGAYISTSEVVADFIEKMHAHKIINRKDFMERNKAYFKRVAPYKGMANQLCSGPSAALVASSDPGFRAHALLNNADTTSMMVLDLHDAAIYGIEGTKEENSLAHIQQVNFFSRDAFGTVYDAGDGYLIKNYDTESKKTKGTLLYLSRNKYMSRAEIAMTNARCINKIYGDYTATAITQQSDYTAVAKIKKLPGEFATDVISKISHRTGDIDYKFLVGRAILSDVNPADKLTEKLLSHYIIIHDTSLANLKFDSESGFSFFCFDTADEYPDRSAIPQSEIDTMREEIRQVVASFAMRCGMNPDLVLKKLGVPIDAIPRPKKRDTGKFIGPGNSGDNSVYAYDDDPDDAINHNAAANIQSNHIAYSH